MQSFVHKSIPEETKKGPHMDYMRESNEVLEMVGDSLYSAAVSLYLKNVYSNVGEGQLSKIRSRIVCGKQMTNVAKQMDLNKYILVSNSVVNAHTNDRFLEDCFEAFVYAVYMDKGFEGVCRFTFNVITSYITEDTFTKNNNYKDILIHFTKVFDFEDLEFNYRQVDRKFIVSVSMNNKVYPETLPFSKKKDAEQSASKYILESLDMTEEKISIQRNIKRMSPTLGLQIVT
jgi:ribonuclease-3